MWQKDMGDTITWPDAIASVGSCRTGGYDDWRMPNVKELFSLIRYTGWCDGDNSITLYIDTEYFVQPIGNTSVRNTRQIDAQTWTIVKFNGTIMNLPDLQHAFGVNFVDGRVKNYPTLQAKYARYVRGNLLYSINNFSDNLDGTVSDSATGLMWAERDSGKGLDWEEALAYSENFALAGYSDWRLPTIKELNSIVDYSKCQNCAAIDETYFEITSVPDVDGNAWYPYFWSSTTMLDGVPPGDEALYQTFGRALAIVNGVLVDAHGPGAIRSDPKSGNRDHFPWSIRRYQGDLQYVYNYVRPVRDIATSDVDGSLPYPVVETNVTLCYSDRVQMNCPIPHDRFYGQDGNYESVGYAIGASLGSNQGTLSTGQFVGNTIEAFMDSNGESSSVGLIISGCIGVTLFLIISVWCWYDRRKKCHVEHGGSAGVVLHVKRELTYLNF